VGHRERAFAERSSIPKNLSSGVRREAVGRNLAAMAEVA